MANLFSNMSKFWQSFLLLFIIISKLSSQPEFSKWFLNTNAGINFSTNPPSSFGGFALNMSEGVSSIADSQGNLLFYCNGVSIYDASHFPMANGSGLFGNMSTTQSSIIVKQPGTNPNYYVFTLDEGTSNNIGAHYSIVDMSLAAGLGSVVTKNSLLYTPCIEKQVAIRHCNGKDVWIVSHGGNTNNFYSYLLSENGLNPVPVISSTGPVFLGIGFWSAGEMKASPDGSKIGWATYSSGAISYTPPCGFHIFDFDASSGSVSNPIPLLYTSVAYGVEFSPDGKKLYGTRRDVTPAATSTLCQWDICSTNTAAIVSSLYTSTVNARLSAIQRAIDNRLYLVNVGTFSLCVINNPNSSGNAMNLSANSLVIGPGTCGQGLPNYIVGYTKPLNPVFSKTVNCQNVNFAAPAYTSSTGFGCSSTNFPINGFKWNFGDSNSVAANTSTIAMPNHFFSGVGTYTVSLIVYSGCENDTITEVINISMPSPSIEVAGPASVCKGEKHSYIGVGGTSYIWNNSISSSSLNLTLNTSTVCTVVGTGTNGCSATKQFSISVQNCTDILSYDDDNTKIDVWPNPFNSRIRIKTDANAYAIIMSMQGIEIWSDYLLKGDNELNFSNLPNGIYILKVNKDMVTRYTRINKID